MNAYIGCAGARCMALPVICVEESIADDLVTLLVKYSKEAKLGKAYEKDTGMGPIVNAGHRDFINDWIETGVKEGAQLVLDGRNPDVPEDCKDGFWVGPTIFDHVTEEMSIGREEVFGPVLIHPERLLGKTVCKSYPCRNGWCKCRHPGSQWNFWIYRT